jgi:hypothetical protein
MEGITINHLILNGIAIIFLAFVFGFIIYGMIKGFQMEKDLRIRNRRRYS